MNCEVEWKIHRGAPVAGRPDCHSVQISEPSDRDLPGWRNTDAGQSTGGDPHAVAHIRVESPL